MKFDQYFVGGVALAIVGLIAIGFKVEEGWWAFLLGAIFAWSRVPD